MSKAHIPKALRQRVAEMGRYRCAYCLMQEEVVGVEMDVDHIIPEALNGPTEEDNLCLACGRCNEYKGESRHRSRPNHWRHRSLVQSSQTTLAGPLCLD